MKRLRVAIVAPSLRILGGQAIQAERLITAWRGDADVEAWIVPVNPVPPRPFTAAVRVKYLRTVATEATYIPRLVREVARADLVHVFSASYTSFLLAPLPAMLIARALGRPVVLNYRSGEAPDHLRRSPIARAAIGAVINVVPSRFLAEVFEGFGIEATIIPNLIDLSRFRYRERDPLRPRILSTRNFDALYNLQCTIRAFRLVQDRWPGASLTLVGGGNADQEAELHRLVAELGARNVSWAGRVHPDAIAAFYADHDIYLQSPNIDNMPASVLEAFASGLPVVSTNAGGLPAMLTDGVHGLLTPPDDHRALADSVAQLLENPTRARAFAQAAQATCRACTWPVVREQWLAVYRAAAAGLSHRSGLPVPERP